MPSASSAPERRLSAVLFADMVDYSSLRQEDALQFQGEMMTFARSLLPRHEGRLVKSLGDGFIAEFGAASAAVAFGIDLQERVAQRNSLVAARQRFRLRIGINAGEIVVMDDDDVGGTTVNVAARAEPLATPGGICMTEEVWQQVRDSLPRPADRLGRLRVKGIRRPMVFYHLAPTDAGWFARGQQRVRLWTRWPGRLPLALIGVGFLLAVAVWLRPVAASMLEHLFPPTPLQRVERASRKLERYDLPGHIQQALAELREAVRLDAKLTEAHGQLGLAYWRRYRDMDDVVDRSEAWASSSNALRCNPDSMLGHFVQGLVAKDESRLHDATNALARANDAAQWENGEIMIELAGACRQLGDTNRVAVLTARADRGHQKPWYYYNALGRFEYDRADDPAAVAAFRAAIKAAPDSPIAWSNLGRLLQALDQHAEARSCFEKSLALAPTAWAYDGLGTRFLAESNWLAAATNFIEAARLNPVRYDLPGKAGLALLHAQGRRAEAEILLDSAMVKVQSRQQRAWAVQAQANLGLYLAGLGQFEKARQTFAALLHDYPTEDMVRQNIAAAVEAARLRGHPEEATAFLKMLDPVGPADANGEH